MGIYRMGIPEEETLFFKENCKIECFIETGTYFGWTSFWASKHFRSVKTIEFSKKLYEEAKERHKNLSNVDFIHGDSRVELRKIIAELNKPAIFWLDAHWCGSSSYGEDDQCPLLEELETIYSSDNYHIVLIDDARLFLCPPPFPNNPNQYPTLKEIVKFTENNNLLLYILEDVIYLIPASLSEIIITYFQTQAAKVEKKINKYNEFLHRTSILKRLIKKLLLSKYFLKWLK